MKDPATVRDFLFCARLKKVVHLNGSTIMNRNDATVVRRVIQEDLNGLIEILLEHPFWLRALAVRDIDQTSVLCQRGAIDPERLEVSFRSPLIKKDSSLRVMAVLNMLHEALRLDEVDLDQSLGVKK